MNTELLSQNGRPPATRRMKRVLIDLGVDEDLPEGDVVVTGGMLDAPGWALYLWRQEPELQPYLRGVRDLIRAERLKGVCASEICNTYAFQALDGRRLYFTWRAWGDLMQAIVGKHEGYLAYYG